MPEKLYIMKNSSINEITIGYAPKLAFEDKVVCSDTAENVLRKIYRKTKSNISVKEYGFLLLLNRNNNITGYYKIAEGGIDAAVVDVRLIFSVALKTLACGIIMCHNHPSGNLNPSESDKRLTKQVEEAGKHLNITLVDHIILTEGGFYSFADESML